MPITLEAEETISVIRLEGEINITCAAELKKLLLEAMTTGKDLLLDLEQATDMDIAAIQLLWATQRETERSGVKLAVQGRVPEAISAMVRDAGFERFPVLFAQR